MATAAVARAENPLRAECVADDPAYALSVLIPTKDRAQLLLQTVASLLAQRLPPGQIVIVDQSQEPAARTAIRDRAGRQPATELVYVHAPQVNGAAAARNRAMSLARGAIWLFLDDDVILEPDFTAALVASYRRQPQAAGISGIITNYAPARRAVRLWQSVFFRGPFADDRQPIYRRAGSLGPGAPLIPVSRLGAGLMSFWASAIGATRFDRRLTGASLGEDVDFCFRLAHPGPLFIAPGARLRHLRGPRGPVQHPLEEAALAAWYLHLEHPHRHRRQAWFFTWLNCGLLAAAAGASLRRRSIAPFRGLWSSAAAAWAIHQRWGP